MGGKPSLILSSPPLWLGGYVEEDFYEEHKDITAVLRVNTTPDNPYPSQVKYLMHISAKDEPETDLSVHFTKACQFIDQQRSEGRSVYVHCAAGISRSTTLVTSYLMAHLSFPYVEALGHVQRCRDIACPNDGFQQQLRDFDPGELALVGKSREADLVFIAETLCRFESEYKEILGAKYIFTGSRKSVPKDLEESVFDGEDGNGLRVLIDGSPKYVLDRSSKRGQEAVGLMWAVLCFEEQKRKLREMFHDKPTSKLYGLEWLREDA